MDVNDRPSTFSTTAERLRLAHATVYRLPGSPNFLVTRRDVGFAGDSCRADAVRQRGAFSVPKSMLNKREDGGEFQGATNAIKNRRIRALSTHREWMETTTTTTTTGACGARRRGWV